MFFLAQYSLPYAPRYFWLPTNFVKQKKISNQNIHSYIFSDEQNMHVNNPFKPCIEVSLRTFIWVEAIKNVHAVVL